jgi:putative acetyltransferase
MPWRLKLIIRHRVLEMLLSNYQIREADNGDIPSVKAVVFTVLQEYGLLPDENGIDSDLNDIETNYPANNGYFGLITNKTGKTVGTFGLYRKSDSDCEIRKMYLLPEARGIGLGKKTIRILIIKALEKGYRNIFLETNSVLKEAIALYEKSGFRKIDSGHLASRCDQAYKLELHGEGN